MLFRSLATAPQTLPTVSTNPPTLATASDTNTSHCQCHQHLPLPVPPTHATARATNSCHCQSHHLKLPVQQTLATVPATLATASPNPPTLATASATNTCHCQCHQQLRLPVPPTPPTASATNTSDCQCQSLLALVDIFPSLMPHKLRFMNSSNDFTTRRVIVTK